MLSTADFLEKQIAFIDVLQHRQLSLQNENLLIKENGKIVNKMSISKLFCIFIIGDCTFSTILIDALHSYNVSIYALSFTLKPRFLIGDGLQGNYVLREKQYKGTIAFPLAREIIKHKVGNQILLLKSIREKDEELKNAIASCTELYSKILSVESPDSMRGYE
jgi:CRISPR-associated protein Cas1